MLCCYKSCSDLISLKIERHMTKSRHIRRITASPHPPYERYLVIIRWVERREIHHCAKPEPAPSLPRGMACLERQYLCSCQARLHFTYRSTSNGPPRQKKKPSVRGLPILTSAFCCTAATFRIPPITTSRACGACAPAWLPQYRTCHTKISTTPQCLQRPCALRCRPARQVLPLPCRARCRPGDSTIRPAAARRVSSTAMFTA